MYCSMSNTLAFHTKMMGITIRYRGWYVDDSTQLLHQRDFYGADTNNDMLTHKPTDMLQN